MEKYLQEKYDESFDSQFYYWHEKMLNNDPQTILKEIDAELRVLYVRLENDQEGRGQVAETGIMGNVAGMEAVRAECLALIAEKA